MDEITYFRDIESEAIFAAVGPMASRALFRLVTTPSRAWECLVPESPDWDSVHQAIFRNSRARILARENLPEGLPPVPKPPQGPFPEWESYFTPEKGFSTWSYQNLATNFESGGLSGIVVFVVLYEDQYETSFGDGEFHYFETAVLSREDADAYVAQNAKEWTKYHIRETRMELRNGKFVVDASSWQRYDRHRADQVIEAVNARIRV